MALKNSWPDKGGESIKKKGLTIKKGGGLPIFERFYHKGKMWDELRLKGNW